MSMSNPAIREMIQRSWNVVDNVDALNAALAKGEESGIDDAVDDLLAAYDSYSGQAKTQSSRFALDEVAAIPDPVARDQAVANELASVLIDLDMAVMLANAAQATGELEGVKDSAELRKSASNLGETLTALAGSTEVISGTTRFAFDEVIANVPAAGAPSPDIATAKANYESQVTGIYDALVQQVYEVTAAAFKGIVNLDAEQINKALEAAGSPLDFKSVKRIAGRVLETVNRIIDTLKRIIGSELFGQIGDRITKTLDEIRKGENIARLFLKISFETEAGQKRIITWLKDSNADQARIDLGSRALADLQQQIIQAFTIEKRIIATLRLLSSPLGFILKRVGGSLPLDLIMGAAYLLVIDIALLRGMDYADTTTLICLVDGITITSKRALVG